MGHQHVKNNSDTLHPGQNVVKRILRWGVEHASIPQSIPRINLRHWKLVISGDVERPLRIDWNTLL